MGYDALERHRQIEELILKRRVGGDLRKYDRFREDRRHGGIVTADFSGCGLACRFCWTGRESLLEGGGKGAFYSPEEAARKLLEMVGKGGNRRVRFSGGEPTIGRDHLFKVLNILQNKRLRVILETNGLLLGAEETYAQELALYSFVHVRVSLKGCSEGEFVRLTGADPRGFVLQLQALRNLVQAGVSAHPAVMISFSGPEAVDRLYGAIWKIDPKMQSEVEREEVIPYPHVLQKLKQAGLCRKSGSFRESFPPP